MVNDGLKRIYTFGMTADNHAGLVRDSKYTNDIPDRHTELILSLNQMNHELSKAKVDRIFYGGDLLNSGQPSQVIYPDILPVLRESGSIADTDVLAGNHEDIVAVSGYNSLRTYSVANLSGVSVISVPTVKLVSIPDYGPMVIVYIPHINKTLQAVHRINDTNYWVKLFQENEIPVGKGAPTSLVIAHGVVAGAVSGSERTVMRGGEQTITDCVPNAFCYLLGHLHTAQQGIFPRTNTPYFYSGSSQCVDFGERNDDKSFIYGEVFHDPLDAMLKVRITRIPFITRKYVWLQWTYEMYASALQGRLVIPNISDCIVKVTLEITPAEKKMIVDASIRKLLSSAYFIRIETAMKKSDAVRNSVVTVGVDPDVAFESWYSGKGYAKQDLKEVLSLHKTIMGLAMDELDQEV